MPTKSYNETRTDWVSCTTPPNRIGSYELRPTQTIGPIVKVDYYPDVLMAWIAFGNAGYQWRGLKYNPKRKLGPRHVLALYTENGEVVQCMPVMLQDEDGVISNHKSIQFPVMKGAEKGRITHALVAWNGGHLVVEINPSLPIETGTSISFSPFELRAGK